MGNPAFSRRAEELSAGRSAFVQLGLALRGFAGEAPWPGHSSGITGDEHRAFADALVQAQARNAWFTPAEVRHAAGGIAHLLEADALDAWLAQYPALAVPRAPRTIGIIMAGNVPFVGFHDLLCVLLAGDAAAVKVASDDAGLTPALVRLLACFAPELAARVRWAAGKLGPVDAIIATGSNNTARYFAHYFAGMPRIIRRSRTAAAVLDGSETADELGGLAEDVFRYFGLGCRNVGKVFIPQDFDLDRLFGAFYPWKGVIAHHKYANNYEYNKAVWLLDRVPLVENGFLLMKEDKALHSPLAALYYERYADRREVEERLAAEADQLQCIVGHGHLPFGQAQCPGPGDYADHVDTMEFLLGAGQGTYS